MMKRLFAAIKIPVDQGLKNLQEELQTQTKYDRINWVNLDNLHLTLKFFGETPEKDVDGICEQLRLSVQRGCPFTMQINRLGVFGSRYQPKVVWLGIQEHTDLINLWRNISEDLKQVGIFPDRQNFVPHLTLGRVKQVLDKKKFFKTIEKHQGIYTQNIHVKEFYLYNSTLTKEGPVYDIIECFEIKH